MTEFEEIDDKTQAVFKKKGYKILKPLAKGSFGAVYKAQFVKTGDFAAVKVINLEVINEKFKNKFIVREMAAMIETKHPNVIKLYDIFQMNKKLYIFMEFAGNGDLMGVLVQNKGPISVSKSNNWFRQSCEGLDYLHNTLFIAHRDLKLDNILLDDKNSAKISDFGFAKRSFDKDKNEVIKSNTWCGTRAYHCPEIIKEEEAYDPFKADVWAMGICLFAMLNDTFPFRVDNQYVAHKQMGDPDHIEKVYKIKLCKHLKRLIRKMLTYDESDRYSIQDVLESKWVKANAKCCD